MRNRMPVSPSPSPDLMFNKHTKPNILGVFKCARS